jgi:hypothetical protein
MTLGEFRAITKDMSDDSIIYYHSYYKGCSWTPYSSGWNYVNPERNAILMNPGDDYDGRRTLKETKTITGH